MSTDSLLKNKINDIIELYSSGNIKEALDTVISLKGQYPNESLLQNISGVCYRAAGQLEMAVKCFERAVEIKPDFADAHYNLGLTLQELNQLDAAVKSYEETLAIQSNYSKAHNNLGIIYKELGQMDNAIMSYEQVLIIQPRNAEAHNNLGNALTELGKLEEAVKSYEQALGIYPDYAEVHNNLGNALNELGQTNDAIKSYKKTLSIAPDFIDAHNNLGNTLKELGQLDEAIKCYEKAIAISPEYAEAHYNLGISLYQLGQINEAIKCYRQALVINPDYADAHNNLGNVLQEQGQSDAAFNCYVHALANQPDNGQFHRNLSRMKNYKEGDTQYTLMQSLLSNGDLSKSDRINLCFALSKAYKDLGKKDELFKVLNEGNQLRKQELNYSIEKDLANHLAHRKFFMSSIKKSSPYESLTANPIFILGMPRSGTSLVEQIISSHYKVHGAGELTYLHNLIRPIMNDCLAHSNDLSEKNFLSIRDGYLNNLSGLNISESIITDKMPINFENIGFILNAFPEAKIIHLKRDSMAICWSIYQHYFPNEGLGFAYNMQDLAKFYNSYTEIMAFWHDLFPNQIYDISYEDLTTNQEEETRKLLNYCDLDWDENCLNFHSNKRTVKTASSLQVREKMYQGSSEVWKKYETHLNPLINGLNYYQNQQSN